jgi:hypothetical protein
MAAPADQNLEPHGSSTSVAGAVVTAVVGLIKNKMA